VVADTLQRRIRDEGRSGNEGRKHEETEKDSKRMEDGKEISEGMLLLSGCQIEQQTLAYQTGVHTVLLLDQTH